MMAGDIRAARRPADSAPRLFGEIDGRTVERELPVVPGRWTDFYENFALALQGKARVLVEPESVRESIRILQAGERSAATCEAVRP